MNRRKIYFVQPNYLYGNNAHLPYAVGTLIAYAWNNKSIGENYSAEKIFFLRQDLDEAIAEISDPFMVCFSAYVWNFEYNKAFAQKLKKKFPACLVVFGGHHVPPNTDLLTKYEYIDILVHGEGEEVFEKLLLSYINGDGLRTVNNISYRIEGDAATNPFIAVTGTDYPSPYATGCFDKMLEDYPELEFMPILETNRGCPFSCSFCDWGNTKQGIRQFPLDRVKKDIDWFAEKRVIGYGGSDSNFGIFERDEAIVDYMITASKRVGLTQKFQVSYIMDDSERVFSISKKLFESGKSRGVTISYQTVSDSVTSKVGRKNLNLDAFKKLLKRYNKLGIPTYTELILGLPGESYESFVSGINAILEAGQHFSLNVHNCEWLPCSEMGNKAYIEKHGIELSTIPLNQPHIQEAKSSTLTEYSRIVAKTNTMSQEDWIDMNLFSVAVQSFHHLGLLQFFALYLYHEKNINYGEFYSRLLEFIFSNEGGLCKSVFQLIKEKLKKVLSGDGRLVITDKIYGDIAWPYEEYVFTRFAQESEDFYVEVNEFLKTLGIKKDIYEDIMIYQKNTLKLPGGAPIEFNLNYDLHSFFTKLLRGDTAELKSCKHKIKIEKTIGKLSWADYARTVVWYGRKDSRNIYSKEVCVYDR